MPSDLAYWFIASPTIDNDPSRTLQDVKPAVSDIVADNGVGSVEIPALKSGTLSNLLTLSDTLPKTDLFFTQTVSKLLDTLKSLLGDDAKKIEQHTRVNDRPLEEYIFPSNWQGWKWDKARWGDSGKVSDVIDALTKEMASIDSVQKARLQSYNLAKGNLVQMQRKLTGNLSTRALGEVVKKEDFEQMKGSEFMETLLVAVPSSSIKDWNAKYERLASMVVPRSTATVAKDSDYHLQSVTIFRKVHDEFAQACRENKFILRDFTYDEGAIEKQRKAFEEAGREEKDLWTELIRLSRTNFSESFKLLVHLKVCRLFVESALRYGLPAEYSAVVVKPDPKSSSKLLKSLSTHYAPLASKSDPARRPPSKAKAKSGNSGKPATQEELGGDWAGVLDEEWLDYVLFEVPRVV